MYWAGVKRELGHIILTLKKWQTSEYASTILVDEEDDFLHGFDTFVDQVSETSRGFAERYEKRVMAWKRGELIPYDDALEEEAKNKDASWESESIKMEIREHLESTIPPIQNPFQSLHLLGRRRYTIMQRRARMLLQSAGFLDIDKLIEYRPPEDLVTFWKRPVAPQRKHTTSDHTQLLQSNYNIVTLQHSDDSYVPSFRPQECAECHHTIRGCMFQNIEKNDITICESCYRDHHYRDDKYLKRYKHCILNGSLTEKHSQKVCRCSTVSHINSDGSSRKLFPVDILDQHRGSANQKGLKCGLINLGTQVAEAKYQGMLSKHEKYVNLSDQKWMDEKRREDEKWVRPRNRGLKTAHQKSLVNPNERVAEGGTSTVFEEDEADDDVPFFMRKFTNRYPFGNVHMALRVGPLIIENGVEQYVGLNHEKAGQY
jgi:hypothetical protein